MSKMKGLTKEFLLINNSASSLKIARYDDFPILTRKALPYKGKLLYFLIAKKEGRDSFIIVPGLKSSKKYPVKNNLRAVRVSPIPETNQEEVGSFIKKKYPDLKGLPFNFW